MPAKLRFFDKSVSSEPNRTASDTASSPENITIKIKFPGWFKTLSLLLMALLLVCLGGNSFTLVDTAQAAPEKIAFRYFDQTGHSISGAIWRYYNRSGGEERFGVPLSELVSVNGKYLQYFERSVLEFNPAYPGTDNEVKQLPIGTLATANQNFPTVAPFANNPNRWYFPETGHSLSFGFLDFWRNHGDHDSLGLPISEEMGEADSSGQNLTVQYFEYAKLEYHPDLTGTNASIQITPLGRKLAQEQLPAANLERIPMSKFNQSRAVRIPSLMFHYVRIVDAKKDPLGFGLSIMPENFVKYLDWIQQNGYHTVTVAQVNDYLRYGIPLPDKPVQLRFDDGHADMWFAYQEMKKRGMTATFFVITQRLELSPSQWQQIDADGFEVAAHTRTHPDLRGSNDLEGEITGSKRDLEAMLGHPVRSFAYPYGKYGPNILRIVQNSGFEIAVSTNGGYGWSSDNYFIEPTISVIGSDTLASFADKIMAAPRASLANSVPATDTPTTGDKKTPGKAPASNTKAVASPTKKG